MKLRFLRNEDGAAAVEFGLISPILALVLGGTVLSGGMVLAYNAMRQAVSSGAQYAMTVSDSSDEIEDVVEKAWQNAPDDADVQVSQACFCGEVESGCSTNCADGDYPQRMTTITASRTYTNFLGNSMPISASQRIRTR